MRINLLDINKLPIEEALCSYLVGKGPSIDFLVKEDFKDSTWPVFCVNESVNVIKRLSLPNPVYAVSQDLRAARNIEDGSFYWFIHHRAIEKERIYPKDTYVYSSRIIDGLEENSITAVVAMRFMSFVGIRYVMAYGFDSYFNIDSYSSYITYNHTDRGKCGFRFRRFIKNIERKAARWGMHIKFFPPKEVKVSIVMHIPTLFPVTLNRLKEEKYNINKNIPKGDIYTLSSRGYNLGSEVRSIDVEVEDIFREDVFPKQMPILYISPLRYMAPVSCYRIPDIKGEREVYVNRKIYPPYNTLFLWNSGEVLEESWKKECWKDFKEVE